MKQSELFKLACECLLLDENPGLKEGIEEKFISGEIDLDKFVYLCSNHLVLPAITLKFQNHGLLDVFPSEYANHLQNIYNLNRKRNREILQQIDEINTALKKENIQPVYLKGTANLMDNLYSDIGDRMIGDIDFLVTEKDYLKTAYLIFKLGYKNDKTVYYDIKKIKHYPRLYREDVPADIEIHRIPVDIQHSKMFSSNLIFENKMKIADKTNCFVSSDTHKLIHTFIHSQLGNRGYRFRIIPLRDLYDFHLLSKRVDWQDVLKEVEEKNKAQIFFDTVSYLLNTSSNISVLKNKNSNKFAIQHKWFLNHPKTHRYYINTLKLYYLISQRVLKAFINKDAFRNIYVRVKDPKGYKRLYTGIKGYFS